MSNVTKNALKGYGFQWEVAILFCFLLAFFPKEFEFIDCEVGDDVPHNFDDLLLKTINNSYYVQIKNYNLKNEEALYLNGKVIYGGRSIELSKDNYNVLVCNSQTPSSIKLNCCFYGIPSLLIDNAKLIIMYITESDIEKYIEDNCLCDEMERQLVSFFKNKLLQAKPIFSSEIPKFRLFDNDLLTKTHLIRDVSLGQYNGILFVVGPPGFGKSHLANEIKIEKKIIYRFWTSQSDKDYYNRLYFDHFLEQITFQIFDGDKRKKTGKEVIEQLAISGITLIIDGLDHVFSSMQSEVNKYISFIDNCSFTNGPKIIILCRPLNNKFYEKYKVIKLDKWDKKQCTKYCEFEGILEEENIERIYKITDGYPIVVHYLCEEYKHNGGHVIENKPIKSLDDYYYELLSRTNLESNLKRLCLITSVHPFFHTSDIGLLYDDSIKNQVDSLIIDYPHLLIFQRNRIFLYHESLYQFIVSKFNGDIFDGIINKICDSLLNDKPNFMTRIDFGDVPLKKAIAIIKHYSDIDHFVGVVKKTIDYESIRLFYSKIISFIGTFTKCPISIYELYSLAAISLILNRNYYDDNADLLIHYFVHYKHMKRDWSKDVFSDGVMYSTFSFLDDNTGLFKKSDGVFVDLESNYLQDLIEEENRFFNVLEYDTRRELKTALTKEQKYLNSKLFSEYLVSGFIYGDEKCIKIVNEYENGCNYRFITNQAISMFGFINANTDYFPIKLSCSKALFRLKGLGVKKGIVEANDICSLIKKTKELNSFEMSDYLNSYIRYSNRIGKTLDLSEVYPYLLMMDAYKDATIIYLPEALAFFVKKGLFTLKQCYEWILKAYLLRDSGNKGIGTDFISLLGPEYVDELIKNNFFHSREIPIFVSNLPVDILNELSFNYVWEYVFDIYNFSSIDRDYVTDEELGTIKKCKHFRKIKKMLAIDKIEIKDVVQKAKQNNKKTLKGEPPHDFYRPEYAESYKKYGFTIEDMSMLTDGWGFKLFDPTIFRIFDSDKVKQMIVSIIFIGFTKNKSVFSKYFQCNAPLLFSIPALYNEYAKQIDYKKIATILNKFLNILFRM